AHGIAHSSAHGWVALIYFHARIRRLTSAVAALGKDDACWRAVRIRNVDGDFRIIELDSVAGDVEYAVGVIDLFNEAGNGIERVLRNANDAGNVLPVDNVGVNANF